MILAIDTSSSFTSIAAVDGQEVGSFAEHDDPRRHAEIIAPMLRTVLAEVQAQRGTFTAIACGIGPGPYTGLRVGIATAKALGLAWGIPVVGLCSLDAVAEHYVAERAPRAPFRVAVDARRSEVYWARYDEHGRRQEGPLVGHREDVPDDGLAWVGPIGVHPDARWIARRVERLLATGVAMQEVDIELDIHGADGTSTSRALDGVELLPPSPLYLRRPDAQEPTK